jgi:hypothetical protein
MNTTTGSNVPTAKMSLAWNAATRTATFTFPGYANGILPDGNYVATLHAAGVTDPPGQPLPADAVVSFFVLAGDANRDRAVNLLDFNILANNFGQSGRLFSQGDFSYDGTVDLLDFNILANKFGQSVGPGTVTSSLFHVAVKQPRPIDMVEDRLLRESRRANGLNSIMRSNGKVPVTERLEFRRLLSQPAGPEFRVNTYTTDSQIRPAIAMDAQGNFVVAWESIGEDGSFGGIYAQRYGADGTPRGTEFKVNTYTPSNQSRPTVAMDADGDFVVAWDSQSLGDFDIYARRYDSQGTAQGAEFRVNTYTTGIQITPAAAMDPDGNTVIVWDSWGQDGDQTGSYAQRLDATGAPQGAEFRVSQVTTGHQAWPAVAMDGDGNFVVAWSGSALVAQRFDRNGVPQGSAVTLNSSSTTFGDYTSVAMSPSGDFVVTWVTTNGPYVRRYNAAGVPQGSEFGVVGIFGRYPKAAMAADGTFVITASRDLGPEIFARRYSREGVPLGPAFEVNTRPIIQRYPCVAMDAAGEFVVAWEIDALDGDRYGIYCRKYIVAPTITGESFLYNTAPHRLRYEFDEDVSLSLGVDDLQVQNLTTTQTIPSSQFTLGYDAVTNTATFAYQGTGGALPDGVYRATLSAAGVTTPNGNPLQVDDLFDFFFLRGDASGNGIVDLDDFNRLAFFFGQANRTFSQGDFNYDGIVNLADFNILASRFGTGLSPATFGGGRIGLARKTDHPDLLDLVS